MPLTSTAYTPEFRAPAGGSSDISFYFTADQHGEWLAATDQEGASTAGWYRPFRDLAGGTLGPDEETTDIFNEGKELVATVTAREEYVLANSVMNHTAVIVNTIRWMKSETFPARYILPPKPDGTFDLEVDGDRNALLFYFPKVSVRQTAGTPTGNGEQRATGIEVRASTPDGGGNVFEAADVNIDDETTWPGRMNPAKNTPAAATT